MSLIDLGELRGDPLPDAGPAALRRGGRLLRATGVVVLALLALAAAAPPPDPLPEATVPARLGGRVHVAGDLLIVADPPTSGAPRLSAYQLPGADLRWQTPLRLPSEAERVTRVGNLLLFSGGGGPGVGSWTAALGATDGSPRWDGQGWADGVTASGLVLTGDSSAQGEVLRAVDPETGQQRWSMLLPQENSYVTFLPQRDSAESLLHVHLSGQLTTYRADTGQRSAVRHLPPPDAGRAYRTISRIGDLLIAADTAGTVTAYGYPGLDRRWSRSVDGMADFFPEPCGRYACIFDLSGGIQVWDPGTGRVIGADRRWQLLVAYGDHLLASPAVDLATSVEPVTVFDPATGRVLRDLGRWRLAVRAGVGVHDSDGPVIGVRIDPVTRRMTIAELDPTETRARILDVVPDVSGECLTGPGVLICRRMDGSLGVWQVDR